jgi:hypothetical protein
MSALIESLAQARHAEHYQHPQPLTRTRRDKPTQLSRRRRAGWMLIGLGLRLAVPSRQSGSDRITLIGR